MTSSQNPDDNFHFLFNEAPISLWDEDFSEVKKFIDQLQASGVHDLRAYCKSHPKAVFDCVKKAKVIHVNKATLKLYKARNKDQLLAGIDTIFTEESFLTFSEALLALAEGKTCISSEMVTKTLTGELMNVIIQVSIATGYEDTWAQVLVSIIDITERKRTEVAFDRVNRALKTLSRCNEVLVHAKGETQFLNNICQVIVEEGGYRLAWVGFAVHDKTRTVCPVAEAGYDEGYLDTVNISWANTKYGQGPTGTAIRTGKPGIARDIQNDTKFTPWRKAAIQYDYRSSIALPLIADEQVLGALNIYAMESDAFDANEVKLLTDLAADLAYGISSLRAQNQHQQADEELRQIKHIVSTSTDMMAILDKDFVYRAANPAYLDAFNKTDDQLIGHSVSEVFGEVFFNEAIRPNAEHCLAGEEINFQGWFDFPAYEARYMDIHYYPYVSDENKVTGFVVNARNITEAKEAETAFQAIVEGLVTTSGQEFFTGAASTLCKWLDAECTIISEFSSEGHVRALGMQLDGKFVEQYEYDLSGTPCGEVIGKGFCVYPENVRDLFPDDNDLVEMQAEGYVGTSIRNKNGKPVGVLCVLSRHKLILPPKTQEVLEVIAAKAASEIGRKHADEKALGYYKILEESLNEIFIFDPETLKFIHANYGARRNIGYTQDELTDLTPVDLKPEFTKELFEKQINPLRTGKEKKIQFTTIHRRKNGSLYPVEIHLQLSTFQSRQVFIAIILDITERVKLQEAIIKSEKLLRNILDGLGPHMLVALMTLDGTLIEANRPALDIAGLKPEDVLGRPFEQAYWWSYSESIQQQLIDSIRRAVKGETCRYDVLIRVGENQFIPIDFTLQPLFDETGKVIYLIPSAVDISERERATDELKRHHEQLEGLVDERTHELTVANERLLELDKLKSMFIASMSHELRTPLNSIIGFSGIILQGMDGEINAQQSDHLGRVKRSARHLLALITDVIDISKIEAGKVEAYAETFMLHEVIDEAVGNLRVEIERKGIECDVVIPPLKLHTDRKRLLQCVLNLVSNASKFTEAGKIVISAAEKDDLVIFSVKDTGIGISEKDMPRLFTQFTRFDSPLVRKTLGTGLGLYLTRKLTVEVLQGTVFAESIYGKGSTFSIRIPKRLKPVEHGAPCKSLSG